MVVSAVIITHLTNIFQVSFFLHFEIEYVRWCTEITSHIALKIVPIFGLPIPGNYTKNKICLCSIVRVNV